jgi:hypothetical protein
MTFSSSGTTNYQLTNSDLVLESFDRIQIRGAAITTEHMWSARRSVNLELQQWANRGVTLFAVQQATPIALVQGQATYTLPTNCVQMLDTYYSFPNGDGTYTDRILLPMTRTEYAEIPNKSTQAPPNRYWFQRTAAPSVTTWQVYDGSQGAALINYFYLRQMEDANIIGNEVPDGVNRFLEALITGTTARLAEKFAPAQWADKRAAAAAAWTEAAQEDREQGPLTIRPNFSRYYGRGR